MTGAESFILLSPLMLKVIVMDMNLHTAVVYDQMAPSSKIP